MGKPFGRRKKCGFSKLRASAYRIPKPLSELQCQELSRYLGALTRVSGSVGTWGVLEVPGSRTLMVGGLTVRTRCSCASEILLSDSLGSMCVGRGVTQQWVLTPYGVEKALP